MTEEEKKAIERIKRILYIFPESAELRTLLNLIQKQDTEINSLKETIQKQEKSREHLKKQLKGEIAVKDTEINKLNNVIDKMAGKILLMRGVEEYRDKPASREEIKEYFMKEE